MIKGVAKMKVRYTVTLEKDVPNFDGIKDIDERLDAIYRDIKTHTNDYLDVDAKVISIDSDIEGEEYE